MSIGDSVIGPNDYIHRTTVIHIEVVSEEASEVHVRDDVTYEGS